MANVPTIAIVDDDESIREALDGLIQSLGLRAALFDSAESFLASDVPASFACIVLDVRMPGLSGLDLQILLRKKGCYRPIIFMTSYVDEFTRAKAIENGASSFLGKPVNDDVLIASLKKALAHNYPHPELS